MTVESRDSAQSHKSSALSPPLGKLAQEKLTQEKTCHVGQITCICSSSQELSPRRETGRGLFDSDGDPHSRAHSPSQRIAARRVPGGSPSEPATFARVLAALFVSRNNNERSRRGQHDGYPDIAFPGGPGRDRGMGSIEVSAEIIAFVPRLHRKRERAHVLPAALRKLQPGDPVSGAGLGVRGE
jgi:hypothetical protein